MRREALIILICASLPIGCVTLNRIKIRERKSQHSPAVALAAFEHCVDHMATHGQETQPPALSGDFSLTIEFRPDETVLSSFAVSPESRKPRTEAVVERCARFATEYFGLIYSSVGVKGRRGPVTIEGTFFPFDVVRATKRNGHTEEMNVVIQFLGRNELGNSLYRLRYYDPRPPGWQDPDDSYLDVSLVSLRSDTTEQD